MSDRRPRDAERLLRKGERSGNRGAAGGSASRAVVAALALAAFVFGAPVVRAGDGNGPPAFVTGRILVKAKPGVSEAALGEILATQGAKPVRKLAGIAVHVVSVPARAEAAVVRALSHNPHVDFAELDRVLELDFTPNDPKYSSAWHLPKISAPTAWDSATGSGITVAVCDTGVDASHADLAGQLVSGWNTASNSSDTSDVQGHGTMVAGTVAAVTNNSTGVASVAFGAKVMPIRVTNASDGSAYSSDIAAAFVWAADHGARVANASYGVSGSSTVANAAKYMMDKGGVVCVSAGNSGSDLGYSDSPYMISVSATNSSDTRTSWSSWGNYVDVAAPGSGIWTTARGGGYSSPSGTSFSSPIVAGVAALVLSARSDLTPVQVESVIEGSAKDLGTTGWDVYYGYGRVDAAAAVAAAKAVTGTPDMTAPSATITAPTGGTVSGTVSVTVSASDDTGVTGVDLLVNGSVVATDDAAPWAFSWDSTSVSDGNVDLVARARDAAGNRGSSSAVRVLVDNVPDPVDSTAPVITSISPADGATVSRTVSVSATATDETLLASLSVYVDGQLLATSTNGSVSGSWNTRKASAGSHTISARAQDAAGNVTVLSVTVTVGSGGGKVGGSKPDKGQANGRKK